MGRDCRAVRAWAPEGTGKQRLRKRWTDRMDPAVLFSGNKVGKDTKKGSTDVPGPRLTFPGTSEAGAPGKSINPDVDGPSLLT